MHRRNLLKLALGGSLAGTLTKREAAAQARVERATRGLPSPKIQDIQVIQTQPDGVRLVVVKIITNQDGLYGYGCATFTQRADLVVDAVQRYLKPLLVGRPTDRIEDTWQLCNDSSYWRNGPVLNNAISGVDMALWDIKGRQAGLPVYQVLGGKCREAADCYGHASGSRNPGSDRQRQEISSTGVPECSGSSGRARNGRLRKRGRRHGEKLASLA